jgi:hypothetical protein
MAETDSSNRHLEEERNGRPVEEHVGDVLRRAEDQAKLFRHRKRLILRKKNNYFVFYLFFRGIFHGKWENFLENTEEYSVGKSY